jgi:hypothetical protein
VNLPKWRSRLSPIHRMARDLCQTDMRPELASDVQTVIVRPNDALRTSDPFSPGQESYNVPLVHIGISMNRPRIRSAGRVGEIVIFGALLVSQVFAKTRLATGWPQSSVGGKDEPPEAHGGGETWVHSTARWRS